MRELLAECDAVITSGGVSVGQKDYLPAVLEQLNADILFAGVAQKPGSPMLAGKVDGKLVFCLSGNPCRRRYAGTICRPGSFAGGGAL